jgi:hypothetical protein
MGTMSGCWTWTGAKTNGYGVASVGGRRPKGRQVRVHRAAYEVLVGPIPDGMHLDHLCGNRACYNPGHLEPVTQAENNRRANAKRTYARSDTCRKGHVLTAARRCRECSRERTSQYRARRAA